MKLSQSVAIVSLTLLASACTRELILPGERLDLRAPNVLDEDQGAGPVAVTETPEATPEDANRALPITLPAQVNHADWTHLNGSPLHRIQHPALSAAPQVVWSADIGQGNDRKHRITATPVVADGRIFTLDSRATVMAHSTAGATLWSADLTPASDRSDDASGGGLAFGDGRLIVTSGFGVVAALDPASGKVLWTQELDANASGAPTVVGGLVYVATKDNRGFAIDAEDGRIRWQVSGTPDLSGVVGVASPAVTDRIAIFPFSSGEMVAALRQGGVRTWNTLLTGSRPYVAYADVTDITGEPVVADGVIYAGTPVGRTVALSMGGKQIWMAREGAVGPVWVSGGSVFLVSDQAELVRLEAATGARIWGVPLPYFTKEKVRKRKAIYANFGPILAGGRIWVASSDGIMRGFDPVDGSQTAAVEISGGATTAPVVAGGLAYLVTAKGQLLALR